MLHDAMTPSFQPNINRGKYLRLFNLKQHNLPSCRHCKMNAGKQRNSLLTLTNLWYQSIRNTSFINSLGQANGIRS